MGQKDIEFLRDLAVRVRDAIERIPRDRLPITFEQFPRGSCGDASFLLGAYLVDSGYPDAFHISAERGEGENWHTHGWVEVRGIIVDITADQFADAPDRIIVSRDSEWHRTFRVGHRYSADFRDHDSPANAGLESAYALMLEQIDM